MSQASCSFRVDCQGGEGDLGQLAAVAEALVEILAVRVPANGGDGGEQRFHGLCRTKPPLAQADERRRSLAEAGPAKGRSRDGTHAGPARLGLGALDDLEPPVDHGLVRSLGGQQRGQRIASRG